MSTSFEASRRENDLGSEQCILWLVVEVVCGDLMKADDAYILLDEYDECSGAVMLEEKAAAAPTTNEQVCKEAPMSRIG